MINYQDRTASDDAAKAAAMTAAKPRIRKKPTIAQAMADLFCDNAARNLPTTETDIWKEGYSADQIREHFPAASRIAKRRLNGIAP